MALSWYLSLDDETYKMIQSVIKSKFSFKQLRLTHLLLENESNQATFCVIHIAWVIFFLYKIKIKNKMRDTFIAANRNFIQEKVRQLKMIHHDLATDPEVKKKIERDLK